MCCGRHFLAPGLSFPICMVTGVGTGSLAFLASLWSSEGGRGEGSGQRGHSVGSGEPPGSPAHRPSACRRTTAGPVPALGAAAVCTGQRERGVRSGHR